MTRRLCLKTHVYSAQSNNSADGSRPCTAVITSVWCSLLSPVLLKAVTLYSYWLVLSGSGTWVYVPAAAPSN